MVEIVLKLLSMDNWYGAGENVDFAKGSDEIPMTFKKGWQQIKRKRCKR